MAGLVLPEHAEIPTVIDVADGFNVVETPYGPSFRCAGCNLEVDP